MPVSLAEARHIARLARLEFTDDELQAFTAELNIVLDYVGQLQEAPTEGIQPLAYPVEQVNVLREDIRKPVLPHSEALKNAPDHDSNFFKVPKVISAG